MAVRICNVQGVDSRGGGEMDDVAIVGAGPVGLFCALVLGQRGCSVAVFERWPEFYPLPRACTIDHEIIRL